MKITIQQADLQKALGVVASVVPNKTTLPVLTCVLMEAEGESLTLSATNLDISVRTTVADVSVEQDGKVAVPAQKFVSFVRSLSAGEVSLVLKDQKIQVTASKANFSESVMNADEFPALPELDDARGHEVPSSTLTRMIKATSYAVSRDETRPALMGILWEIKPTSLSMIATDAHRLAKVDRKMDWGVTDVQNVIADTQGLLKYLPIAETEETTTLHVGDHQISFIVGATVLHTRVLEGPFPDYTAVIPKNNDLTLTVDREAFVGAVKRVSITADRITSQICLGIEPDRMELSAEGTDGSRAEDEIPAGYAGEALEIGFNYAYLLDVLKNLDTDEVQMTLKDPQSATLLKPMGSADDDVLCLLMPLRLTSG